MKIKDIVTEVKTINFSEKDGPVTFCNNTLYNQVTVTFDSDNSFVADFTGLVDPYSFHKFLAHEINDELSFCVEFIKYFGAQYLQKAEFFIKEFDNNNVSVELNYKLADCFLTGASFYFDDYNGLEKMYIFTDTCEIMKFEFSDLGQHNFINILLKCVLSCGEVPYENCFQYITTHLISIGILKKIKLSEPRSTGIRFATEDDLRFTYNYRAFCTNKKHDELDIVTYISWSIIGAPNVETDLIPHIIDSSDIMKSARLERLNGWPTITNVNIKN